MNTVIRKIGNSEGVILPRELLQSLNLKAGDSVIVSEDKGGIVLKKTGDEFEEQRVAGAIKTDFILSAEIMTIALAAIEAPDTLTRALVLLLVAVGITFFVYGAVALLVKMDDAGLVMAQAGRLSATRAFGRGMVKAMPYLMSFISTVGTAAMLWVGGSIVLHGLSDFGLGALPHWVEHVGELAGHAVPAAAGAVEWLVNAAIGGVFGLALGLLVIPVAKYALTPVVERAASLFGR